MATPPSADHQFKTHDDAPTSKVERSEMFHQVTAQILLLAHCGRSNLLIAISFLTKQVQEDKTHEDDYKKLNRFAKYMRRTKFLRLTIEAAYLG